MTGVADKTPGEEKGGKKRGHFNTWNKQKIGALSTERYPTS
jgi:hypothetical protein